MPAKLIYLQAAELDLEAIYNYISQDNQTRAYDYVLHLYSRISELSESPKLGVSCKRKKLKQECYMLIIDNYLVFYKYDEIQQLVTIGRVLHSSVEYRKKQLFNLS